MNKQTELSILRDTIAHLGNDSYCGPWLASQLDAIESAMASDECPSIRALSPTEARKQAEEIVAQAQAQADRIIAHARTQAQHTVADAHRRATNTIDTATDALRAALARL